MPIYEFYCSDCNVIYNFFCRRIVTDRKPACPRCGRPDLEKLISRVSVIGRAKDKSGGKGRTCRLTNRVWNRRWALWNTRWPGWTRTTPAPPIT